MISGTQHSIVFCFVSFARKCKTSFIISFFFSGRKPKKVKDNSVTLRYRDLLTTLRSIRSSPRNLGCQEAEILWTKTHVWELVYGPAGCDLPHAAFASTASRYSAEHAYTFVCSSFIFIKSMPWNDSLSAYPQDRDQTRSFQRLIFFFSSEKNLIRSTASPMVVALVVHSSSSRTYIVGFDVLYIFTTSQTVDPEYLKNRIISVANITAILRLRMSTRGNTPSRTPIMTLNLFGFSWLPEYFLDSSWKLLLTNKFKKMCKNMYLSSLHIVTLQQYIRLIFRFINSTLSIYRYF